MMRAELSILDLVPITEGATAKDAIERSMRGAELADELGYKRYWFAEHHNTSSLASSATALLIGRAASRTSRIRVGAGGVMLPNHAPLVVAENYGTLANMFGERIDLGLGRAPGTDPLTAQLLRRTAADPQSFATAIHQMQGWMSDDGSPGGVPISSAASAGTNVPMWVLGSTVNGASIAAQLGLPFSVASHFAPDSLDDAISLYRANFNPDAPTAQISEPRVMVGVNILVADSDQEAEFEFTSHMQMMLDGATNKRRKVQPPAEVASFADDRAAAFVNATLRVRAVGSPATVKERLDQLQARTEADEFIFTSYIFNEEKWHKSLRLLADLWGMA
ncbi:LLM class flavin-dependent oxidoreductase [Trueperella bialowiezensis]|uniref:Limonene 1,2-monooxygenase n=1 Tax=Trueperella bialowiezensis TaxID=312285 RepID=A0A3S4V6Y3_9ACTO|nr:LLM class flavin-dependent oxidoreductase [Trueperella bialowiezensis]VEI13392.1 Limonene 1,2-monooxygenase [Trueperella bialowiezensis]